MTSTPRQLKILDGALLGAKIIKDASEAAPVLGPLKATAGLVITILETIRVSNARIDHDRQHIHLQL
ncbi:hypothetical protein FRB91_009231 [Serendipita sp. 411]|nr:hypothetical protein FRB91_009231 [Serendipita sp. 411]